MAEAEVIPLRNAKLVSDLDAEQAVLSAIMNAPERYDEVVETCGPHMMYSDANRRIFDAIVELRESARDVDIVTVAHQLELTGRLAQVGGSPYLVVLIEAPYVLHVQEHAKIVRERWRLRCALKKADTVSALIRSAPVPDDEVQALLEETELAFGEIAHQQQTKFLIPIRDSLEETYKSLQLMSERGDAITGIPMGFKEVDVATSGLHKGDLYIVAGRPGSGKTAYAMNIVVNVAEQNKGAAVFSLEMPDTQLVTRILSSESRIPLQIFRTPNQIGNHWDKIATTLGELEKLPIWIDDTGGITISELRARVRKLKSDIVAKRAQCDACEELVIVVVDYIQLVEPPRGGRQTNREQEVSHTSRQLKLLAKQENVAVIALSQLNRSVESRKGTDKRPQLSDLRESGAIEQDADTVMFIYRPEMYAEDPELEGVAEVIVGKQRNGPCGIHKVAFSKECVRFDRLARTEFDEYDMFQDA